MSKTKIFIAVIMVIIIGVATVIFAYSRLSVSPEVFEKTGGETADIGENPFVKISTEASAPGDVAEDISKRKIIELTVDDADGFKPKTFTVKAGETVIVKLTCTDMTGHIMQFRDSKIELALPSGPKGSGAEISGATYKVPSDMEKGEYEFYDILAERNSRPPLIGKMIIE